MKIAVEKKLIQEMVNDLSRIMRPVAEYDNNNETYLKRVIATQTDRAVVIMNRLNTILDIEEEIL